MTRSSSVEETDLGYCRLTVPVKGADPVVKELDTFAFYLALLGVGEAERKAGNMPEVWKLRAEWLGKELAAGCEVSHLTAFCVTEQLHALVELTKKNALSPGSAPTPDTTGSQPSGSAAAESPPG